MDFGGYATALAEDRRERPQHDLCTALVEAEVDGERLSSNEVASFFILLAVAGNETTRNAISHGVLALSRYPERAADLVERLRRAAAQRGRGDRALGVAGHLHAPHGQTRVRTRRGPAVAAGDKVSMWYNSADRDEATFADPWTFDVTRNPNPHFGFGGGGAHFCLGANLARREIAVVFEELRAQVPDIAATEEPDRLMSPFIHGIKRLPVAWTPPA